MDRARSISQEVCPRGERGEGREKRGLAPKTQERRGARGEGLSGVRGMGLDLGAREERERERESVCVCERERERERERDERVCVWGGVGGIEIERPRGGRRWIAREAPPRRSVRSRSDTSGKTCHPGSNRLFNCLDVHHKSPDSGERQYKPRTFQEVWPMPIRYGSKNLRTTSQKCEAVPRRARI